MAGSPVLRRYLDLLETADLSVFEDRVVALLLRDARKSGEVLTPPIRLFKIVSRFSIIPVPQFITGSHDGELEFDSARGRFVIKLCVAENGEFGGRRTTHTRDRFTYAHEVAHRFFFVPRAGGWERALEVATSDLSAAEGMKERITLAEKEEELCNNIARRVLVPEEFLNAYCQTKQWFESGRDFFYELSYAASLLDVSRDCLLVRLDKSSGVELTERYAAFIVRGAIDPSTGRTVRRLKLANGIFPAKRKLGKRRLYPGFEWAKAGREAYSFVADRLREGKPSSGELDLCLSSSEDGLGGLRMRGWWRLLDGESVALWGSLQ